MPASRRRSTPIETLTLAGLALLWAGRASIAAEGPRSQDDRGFSITLVSPTSIYLTGRRTIRIEPIIPRGDAIEQVDFFIDGHLASIDVRAPYAHEADFGDDIRRHTIEVRALTRQGRRAKISMVSRSGDVTEGAVGPVETLAAVVRNASGRPVDGLSVSDFEVLEAGARQPIVHFEGGGAPASFAVVLASGDSLPLAEVATRVGGFLRGLARQHSAMIAGDAPSPLLPGAPAAGAPAPGPSALFSYDLADVAARLSNDVIEHGAPPGGLAHRLQAAATALINRRGARVVLALVERGDATPVTEPQAKGVTAPEPPAADPVSEALEAVLRTDATLYIVSLGQARPPGEAEESPDSDADNGRYRAAAEASGGQLLEANDLMSLDQALGTVADSLRHRYLISYMPTAAGRTGRRVTEVKIRSESLVVEAPRAVDAGP